ncbi:MAG: TonB-dependent receptor [Proteobacteria bacterium]|nr:TonB-dependent receptor [Pseudomonadota bacterium]
MKQFCTVYLAGITLALGSALALAQTSAPPMEHVLVSVPLHKKSAETALPVTVLSGDALRRAASSTIGDTLNNSPGLSNASFGPGVGQPVIRGQQGARVTVLQNGTSSGDASNISADHAVSVEAVLADSIEVLRGPATLLYGGGAIGGVVNILDNRIPTSLEEGVRGGAEYRYDSASGMNTVVGRMDAGSGSMAWHADALYRDWADLEIPGYAVKGGPQEGEVGEKGEIHNTDGRTKSMTLGGSYHFDDGFFGMAVNRLENEYGIPSGAHEHEGDEDFEAHEEGDIRLDVEQTRYDAALHWHDPFAGAEIFRGFLSYTDYQHAEIEGSGEIGTLYSNETTEARLELVHDEIVDLHGVFGLQLKSGEFSAIGEESFVPVTQSTELGLFLLEDYHRDAWTFELGLRLDSVDRDPDTKAASAQNFSTFSLSGSILWSVSDSWRLGLALSRAERAPAIEELFSNVEGSGPEDWVLHAATGAIELGNADLNSEVSNNLDLTLSWTGNGHFVETTVFYNDFSDYINLTNTGLEVEHSPVLIYAQDDAEFYGVEIESEFNLGELANGDITLALFADSIRGTLGNGEDAPRLPPLRISGRLDWSNQSWGFWTRVMNAAEQDRSGENEDTTDGYTRWDLGGDYRLPLAGKELLLFASVKNITGEEVRLSTSFLRDVAPEAGRSLELGVRLEL